MSLENLSPIVRSERLLAGEDLEPVTRLEYFLKQAGSGGGFPVPSPAAADTGKVLTANNGAVEWKPSVTVFDTTISGSVYTFNSTWQEVYNRFMTGLAYVRIEHDICQILAVRGYAEGKTYEILVAINFVLVSLGTDTPTGYPSIDLD